MAALTLFKTDSQDLTLLQTSWKPLLDQLLKNPANTGGLVKSIILKSGLNTIDHGLSRELQGWMVIRKRANANIYDTQDQNPYPSRTLLLISDAAVTIDLMVF